MICVTELRRIGRWCRVSWPTCYRLLTAHCWSAVPWRSRSRPTWRTNRWADWPATGCWPLTAGAKYIGEAGQDLSGAGTGELTDLLQVADRSLLERSTLEKQVKTYLAQEQVSWLTCCRLLTPHCWSAVPWRSRSRPTWRRNRWADWPAAGCWPLIAGAHTLEKQVKTYTWRRSRWADWPVAGCWPLTAGSQFLGEAGCNGNRFFQNGGKTFKLDNVYLHGLRQCLATFLTHLLSY